MIAETVFKHVLVAQMDTQYLKIAAISAEKAADNAQKLLWNANLVQKAITTHKALANYAVIPTVVILRIQNQLA